MTFAGKSPAIVEWRRGAGRIVVAAIAPKADWTNWGMTPYFLPCVIEFAESSIANRYAPRVARDVSVLGERREVLGDPRRERRGRIPIVVEMELDLSKPPSYEPGELLEEVRAVLLAGEEPAVTRRSSIAVAE